MKIILFFLAAITFSNAKAQPDLPGSQIAADTPAIFGNGILSDGLSNRDFSISPDGTEIFFTVQQPQFALSTILHIRKHDGSWGRPEVAPFSGVFRDLEASFSPDGKTIYFSSDRPVNPGITKKDFDIWRVRRMSTGNYGQPENLGPIVNSNKNEFYPSSSRNGNLYFTVEAPYGKGSEDIVWCKFTDSGFASPESLPEDINTKFDEFNAFIDPDEQFILFTSYGRPDDLGLGDLYISHRDKNGLWSKAKHLPAPVNSSALDYCPFVSPDKKYFVFTSNRLNKEFADGKQKDLQKIKELLAGPGNGLDDIYWMKFNADW